MEKKIVELFAGVGGFRLAFEDLKKEGIKWDTVFFNQWEPSSKNQFAYKCYTNHFGVQDKFMEQYSNVSIMDVPKKNIPNHTILVGGFPCQDYSVATTAAKGIEGKKGVLWWEIYETIKIKKPQYCLLENVDRLLKSPSMQRGRDFAIILKCMDDLGYDVEWRVINAAEYGEVQRRRRVFIFANKRKIGNAYTKYYKSFSIEKKDNISEVQEKGFFNSIFPSIINPKKTNDIIEYEFSSYNSKYNTGNFYKDIQNISDNYDLMFRNSGILKKGKLLSYDVVPKEENKSKTLSDIIIREAVEDKYFLTAKQDKKFEELRGGRKTPRISSTGHKYVYTEGRMNYPDNIDNAGRTMLTSEGTVNRSTHVIFDHATNNKRFITPVESERMNGFPDGWTNTGMTDRQRYFCMGNALVIPIVVKMARKINSLVDTENIKSK